MTSAANIGDLQAEADARAFIGIARVCRIAGFSKATILRMVKARTFPAPVLVSGNVVRYDLHEVLEWREQQFQKRAERLRQQQSEPAAA